ncbi:ABC transporter ATP-binding protein [Maridesulfovibrio bastinii]|uniref:ABC transporter ATP-binding protein/permease n=1 Tax=Maridesulfovibrio bastinii TaxID=47157 RepID=UPI000422E927|nr:ABC transporter ATP-binding protein [Maridesulfovibrio bastinii]
MLEKIRALTTRKEKRTIVLLVALSVLISAIETVGISAILPFISLANDFSLATANKYYNYVYQLLGFNSPEKFIIVFGYLLIIFYISRGFINLLYFYLIHKFSQGMYLSLGTRLFTNYVNIKYQDMTTRNSSDLSKKLITEMDFAAKYFYAFLLLISELFVSTFLYCALLYVDYKVTIALTLFMGIMVVTLLKTVSVLIKKEGNKRNSFQEKYYRAISETLNNLKFIKLLSGEKKAVASLQESGKGYTRSVVMNNTYSTVPRLSLEGIGFSLLIGALLLTLVQGGQISRIIPVISLFALAMYRLLPSANRILNSYNIMQFYSKTLDLIYEDYNIETQKLGNEPIDFNNEISIENLSFKYNTNTVLDNITLNIKKGEKIALIGESGSGKSTLADIIIGMYSSYSGKVKVDGVELGNSNLLSWRKKIGYIPQSIYLFDSTVAENVTFGRSYDEEKIYNSLEKSKILSHLEHKDGLQTMVGENGTQLSGGQKQRIGIARALYGNPEVYVMDEATASLDKETESQIMEQFFEIGKNKTLIIIAHRLSTIEKCDTVYRIKDKKIYIEKKNDE